MRTRHWLAIGIALVAPPAAAAAQTRDCTLVKAAKAQSLTTPSAEMWFISGPAEFTCSDGTEVEADSAIYIQGYSLELIGNVFYADSARTLEAEHAIYYVAAARLHARENVVLTDRQNNGSVIRSDRLTHERTLPERPEARTTVTGTPGRPRPHATIHPRRSGEAAPSDTAAQPFEIDADWMEIRGEGRFTATGNVSITRGETRSGANGAMYDQADEQLVLDGAAWVEQEDLRLQARRIDARLAGDQLRTVTALEDARLRGRELEVDARTIRLDFEEGQLQRLVAVVPPATAGEPAPERPRAVAVARDLRLVADSIDALAPGQKLREIVAVGDAFAQRQADSLSVGLPELIANDWVSGDTINAYFALSEPHADSAAADAAVHTPPAPVQEAKGAATDTAEVVLERLVVIGPGGQAQALYRVSREGSEAGAPSINYTIADRITLVLSGGEVKEAEATGDVRGRYLEPQGKPGRPVPEPGSPAGPQQPTTGSR